MIKKREEEVRKPKKLTLEEFVKEAEVELSSPKEKRVEKSKVSIVTKTEKKSSPLIIVKGPPTEDEIAKWLSTAPGFIEGLTETDFKPTKLYRYQVKYLNRTAMFWHIDKGRQTGFSYTFAAEALAKAHLMNKYTKIFISINQDEANEKVTYARAMYDSMPTAWQKRLITDNKKCLEFEGLYQGRTTRTRIISHAQREPRGKGGNTEVVLDEAAHYQFGNQIYVAALPIITRGKGGITVASTPMGKSGIHWEIVDKPEHREIYQYQKVYWWDCIDFVKPGLFKEARKMAPKMNTVDRISKYGNEKMKSIYLGFDLESFMQEYECYHIDETVAFFPLSLIKRCTYSLVTDNLFLEEDENAESIRKFPIESTYPKTNFFYCENIDDLLYAKRSGKIKGPLHAGFDVGRRQHSAELIICEDYSKGPIILRGRIHFYNVDFEAMEAELERAILQLEIESLRIDETGPGIELAENMTKRYPGICEAVTFTNTWKESNASHIRRLMESQNLAIPDDREVKNQIHSIKRTVTDHGNLRFDAEENKSHHGDVLWGLALAVAELRFSDTTTVNVKKVSVEETVRENIVKRPEKRVFTSTSPMTRKISGLSFNNGLRREERL
jgi:phage FluMu gp28-like protein